MLSTKVHYGYNQSPSCSSKTCVCVVLCVCVECHALMYICIESTCVFFQSCSDCSGANPAWVILLTLIFGLLLVVMVVLLNLGASAPLDSLLFFLQVSAVWWKHVYMIQTSSVIQTPRPSYRKMQLECFCMIFLLDNKLPLMIHCLCVYWTSLE